MTKGSGRKRREPAKRSVGSSTSEAGDTVLVITGMHRSGTSLVAGLLEKAGLDLGEKLLAADKDNPRGYFEDVDFYEFHREALATRQSHVVVAEDFVFEPTVEERQHAETLVAKRQGGGLWGWKDPRASLFLDFWNERLPHARFLFLFRHPLDVLLSLVRRGDVNFIGLNEGIDAWVEYNERILRFFRDHRERSLLCHIRGIAENLDSLFSLLRERTGIEIATTHFGDVYHPEELRHVELTVDLVRVFRSIHPSADRLYHLLNEAADLGWSETPTRSRKLEGFVAWVAALNVDASPGLRRGLTSTLLALTEPDSLETLYRDFARFQQERERGLRWLKRQLDALEGQLARSARRGDSGCGGAHEKLTAGVEELERGRDWLEGQRSNLTAELKRSSPANEELRAWVKELERGRDWLQEQRRHFEEDRTRRAQQHQELLAWVEELVGRGVLLRELALLLVALTNRWKMKVSQVLIQSAFSPLLALHHLFFAIQKVVIGGELDLINVHVFQGRCFRQLQKYFDRPERGQFTRSEKLTQDRVHSRFAQARRILQNLEIVLARLKFPASNPC